MPTNLPPRRRPPFRFDRFVEPLSALVIGVFLAFLMMALFAYVGAPPAPVPGV